METRPPTVTRILVAIGFALSCFALALFLWIAFGGPLPLKPEGYRVTIPFKEATQLAAESDVRISGVNVGKVKSISLADNGLADATIEVDSQYAPIPVNTRAILRQKTLLGETYVELTPGNRGGPTLPEGGTLPTAQVSQAVQLDEIFRTFNARTRQAFKVWMQGSAAALTHRGADLSAAIAELGPFAEETNRLLRVLDSQQHAVTGLVHNGGEVFHALSERKGQLRGLIENSNAVFQTTARRNTDLEQIFQILPTFQRESRLTLARLNSFAANTDPLVRQLQPAAKELSPTLIAAGKAAPDLKRFFVGLRGTIKQSDTGFPALRRLLSDDLTPLFSRLGSTVGGRSAYLAHLNSIVQVLGMYKHEIAAFFANASSATNGDQPAFKGAGGSLKFVKQLRTTSPLSPESLAAFGRQVRPVRANPYFKPLGYNRIAPDSQGRSRLQTFANTACGAGITATLPPESQVVNDPNFNVRTQNPPVTGATWNPMQEATELYQRIRQYAMGNTNNTNATPAPPCRKQGSLKSVGKFPEFTKYLHVRAEP
jgi:phospholipid/cholesterol/gamma-HCH transport system substrate-binding protein